MQINKYKQILLANNARNLKLAAAVLVILAIPLTVFIAQREQNLTQNAAQLTDNTQVPKKFIRLNSSGEERDRQNLLDTKPLGDRDLAIKEQIINSIDPNNPDAPVFSSNNVSLIYVASTDEFIGEILSSDQFLAKTEAENWLRKQGMSPQGICNLPLHYYLSRKQEDQMPDNTLFDPTPLVCSK